ncbi:hypothetical protein Pmar_PMAR013843 [Perkinsus marinus ATCC 50983]|uniref:ATP-dependent DNA helicase n=1 Tax=Perkinsus marinus (strain ATCC 50983 / TXsc) TaxID=423536 RepID=C5L927_PERM5|nr:hypothetical protein Pmar_PMAR013843 [Perkinsus marinus ATCC 50983]EER06791.1 hypothetical protein Pmar_PMAR013843 [Perkinsus marinus ATCC 50983]|eukprot:XP_002774975.1 hypothetical protein Pmar_PMAR013843 [Perkinsus marinus ATCC 50983]
MSSEGSLDGLDDDQKKSLRYIQEKLRSHDGPLYMFITGYAGTGKSTLLHATTNTLSSEYEVVILTWNALAARSIRGQTIMSFFSLSYEQSGIVGDNAYMRDCSTLSSKMCTSIQSSRQRLLRTEKLVIVLDEIGAIHNTILDAISQALQAIRKGMDNCHLPFGGVPVIMAGDPCQLGRVELCCTSPKYSPDLFPTMPCWKSTTWRDMDPVIIYLRRFHRGGGTDHQFLNLLKEIRASKRVKPGVPEFSGESLQLLQTMRDRDGGKTPPRYEHVCICLTNDEADKFNEDYLASLPGEMVELQAEDELFGTVPPDNFHIDEVSRMGFKNQLRLKLGSRILMTSNDQDGRFVNGDTGRIQSFHGLTSSDPYIKVQLDDRPDDTIDIRRRDFTVYKEGAAIFNRRQFPLTVGACFTGHKCVGMTLPGVWCRFPFGGRTRGNDANIEKFWSRPWLHGAAYTIFSRVGRSDRLQVHPLRRSERHGIDDVLPMFHMSEEALQFDEDCRTRSWLTDPTEQPLPPRSESPAAATAPRVTETIEDHSIGLQIRDELDALRDEFRREFRNHSTRLMLLHDFSETRTRRINPVFYCWTNPELMAKIDTFTPELQREFYQQLDEALNLTEEMPTSERLSDILEGVAAKNVRRRVTFPESPNIPVVEPSTGRPTGLESQPGADLHGERLQRDDEEFIDDLGSEPDIDELDNSINAPDDPTAPSLHVPRPRDDRFEDKPFAIKRGAFYETVTRYLEINDHLRLEHGYTLEKLKSRQSCRIECRRSVAKRHRSKQPSPRNPDWRLWPAFQCPLSEILVKAQGSFTYFYGLKGARADQEAWRNHSHPVTTWKCHSAFVPPDIIDDWCEWVDEEPGIGLNQLEDRTYRKQRDYCAETIQFLVRRELNHHEKTRGAYRSIKEHGKAGLSIHAFLRQLAPITVKREDLAATILPILDALAAVEESRATEEQAELAVRADDCILLSDVLCIHEEGPRKKRILSQFCAVLTSARMLRNMTNVKTVGLDATFNLLYADVVLGVMCQLPQKDAAKPVALAIMRSEAASSVKHLLKQVKQAAETLNLADSTPVEAVMDGSDAIHKGAIETYGESLTVISCYFHTVKNARKLKSQRKLPSNIWREILTDIETLADNIRERPLSESSRSAIQSFMDDFDDYLNPNHWRSYWGSYGGQHTGPRTNNSVERFNRQLKDDLMPGRSRITLSEFAAIVRQSGPWTRISQYGKSETRGNATSETRRRAAEYYIQNSFCQIPRSWRTNVTDMAPIKWLFSTNESNLRDVVYSNANEEVKRFCSSNYSSLREAQNLKGSYSIVAYKRTPDFRVPALDGPFCTCRDWVKALVCPHVLCISYSMGHDNTQEALREWSTILVNFPRPRQRRDAEGKIGSQKIPRTARHGLTEGTGRKRRRVVQSSESQPRGTMDEDGQTDPHVPDYHENNDEERDGGAEQGSKDEEVRESERTAPKLVDYNSITWPVHPDIEDQSLFCGCGRGHWPEMAMIKCSKKACPYQWWHVDCAMHYATAMGIPSGLAFALHNKKRWYCFTCRGRSWTVPKKN